MDINGDGNLDILSGSYSRQSQDMAGLFQVLWGNDDGTFRKAETLNGADGEPLIIPAGKKDVIDKICTRPTAVDLDGDGTLDIVSGNFRGTFFMFRGTGPGTFEPTPTKLMAGDKPLAVDYHSDPFFVDWDDDGDMDMLSGSGQGGVFLAVNTGTRTEPRFEKPKTLIEPVKMPEPGPNAAHDVRLRDDYMKGPQTSTRVWASDVNDDGKLDVLVGDQVSLFYPAEGVSDDDAIAGYTEWLGKQSKLYEAYPQGDDEEAAMAWQKRYDELMEQRRAVVDVDVTGFVWVYHQK